MEIVFWIIAFAVAITIHEAAHAWMADYLGDPTPRLEGRLSLNPIVHYDRVGTTLLLVLVILRSLSSIPGFEGFRYILPFGWAKPVRFDPYNLKNPRRDAALISLAGPAANIILATLLAIILKFLLNPFSPFYFLPNLIFPLILLNVSLGIFNLIPVHPLDGGKILVGILPAKNAHAVDMFLSQYGTIILIFLIFPTLSGNSPVSLFITPLINFVLNLLLPGSSFI